MDTPATVEQCVRIILAGADLVRLTVRNQKEAENLKNIKSELNNRGFFVPLAADVHFNPKIAEISAGIVEKVRINPGNFAGIDIPDKLIPLIHVCKKNHTALRIGVNHGSLSARIMEKYGDTPEGMVESAMEYLRICVKEKFYDIVVSLKASNTRIMIWSNRLLRKSMQDEGMDFPIHIGVTEAGEGEDGRIRSAVGIGTLLGEGMGDTIRISLTEDPENEIPVARKLVTLFENSMTDPDKLPDWNQLISFKRKTNRILNIGDMQVPVVISSNDAQSHSFGNYDNDIKPDYFFTGKEIKVVSEPGQDFPFFTLKTASTGNYRSPLLNFISLAPEEVDEWMDSDDIVNKGNDVLVIHVKQDHQHLLYQAFKKIIHSGSTLPVIIHATYDEPDPGLYLLKVSSDLGRYFIDRLADGIWIENPDFTLSENIKLSFNLLQAARSRMFKTEYIACPSCGRTLFNIQNTLARVKAVTSHLKHLKIAVMGCIVNGPGEMADADYGFVGSAPGKVTLFKQKEAIKKNIPEDYAINALIDLIKENDDWMDP
jgi:(E)-4-hydroxy-3-methylbut-2-enyl-diphosphate synthase